MFHFSKHQHKFSPTYLSCVSVVFFSEPGPVVHSSSVKIPCGMALLRNTPPPQVLSSRGSSSKVFSSIHKIKIDNQDEMEDIGQRVVPQPIIQCTMLARTRTITSDAGCFTTVHSGTRGKMKDKHELITLNERALLQVFLAISKFRGNLIQCFHAKVNLFKTLEKGLLFHQIRSPAIVLYDTLPAVGMEKVECMKTKDDENQKVRLTPRVPRVVLKNDLAIRSTRCLPTMVPAPYRSRRSAIR